MDTTGTNAYTASMTLGERVKAMRTERGWTQAELARRSGLNGQTVHRIEHNAISAGWQSRTKLARAFGIPVAALDSQVVDTQEAANEKAGRASSYIALASLTEQQILEGIAAFVKELERRQGGNAGADRPPVADDSNKPTARPRRHR